MRSEDLGEALKAVPYLMRGFPSFWCVAGGWAIDLYLGRVTRSHGDVELAIFRQDQSLLHTHFSDWRFGKVAAGHLTDWVSGEYLSPPIHEIHARTNTGPPLSLEFLLNDRVADAWAFRRNLSVTLPLDQAIRRGHADFPILNPGIVLLFKAKNSREKDELDSQATLNALSQDDRRWLRSALLVCHPGHPWIPLLG